MNGISVMVVIFVMLILIVVGYSMTRIMATKQRWVLVTAQFSSAFNVAKGESSYAGKDLSDLVS